MNDTVVAPVRVLRARLASGTKGTAQTLALMRLLAERGARDLTVREQASRIVQEAGVRPHDFAGELVAVFRWVRDRVRFTRDPYAIEALQAPRYTLAQRIGDCDDKAIVLVSLLRALGHPAELRYRVIGADRTQPGRYSHVYVVARLGSREIPLDPTPNGAPVGWQYPKPTRVGEVAA